MNQINPKEVDFLIIGGGIHGVGVAHDLASRGARNIMVLEKSKIGSGTSSKSTKLIHGGLRYLKHIRDFSLVAEGLHERKLLLKLAPDLVKPIEFLFPVMKDAGMPSWMIHSGLYLYDFLAGKDRLQRNRTVPLEEFKRDASIFETTNLKACFSFWDGQTDDLALTNRVAESARKLNAQILENTKAEKIQHDGKTWNLTFKRNEEFHTIATKIIINAAGPWAHELFAASSLKPGEHGVNVKGSHLLCRDLGLKKGVFLQSPTDQRIFFVLPWLGKTLIGTTESLFHEPADTLKVGHDDVSYLLDHTNQYLQQKILEKDIEQTFTGLRWLATEKGKSATQTSRSFVLDTISEKDSVITTIYGGKLTAYRALAQTVVETIDRKLNLGLEPSQTDNPKFWISPSEKFLEADSTLSLSQRFAQKNIYD